MLECLNQGQRQQKQSKGQRIRKFHLFQKYITFYFAFKNRPPFLLLLLSLLKSMLKFKSTKVEETVTSHNSIT